MFFSGQHLSRYYLSCLVNSAVILQVNSYYTIITDNNSSGDGDGDATETEDTEVAEVTVDTEDSADTAAATAVDCSLHRCTNTVCSKIKNLCSLLQAKNRSVLQAGHSATFDNSDIQKPFQKIF